MAGDRADPEAPLLGRADQLQRAGLMDGVPVESRGLVAQGSPGLAGAPAEVGVLARRVPVGLVEAVQLLEQGPRVGDVAGLEPRAGPSRRLRPRKSRQQV